MGLSTKVFYTKVLYIKGLLKLGAGILIALFAFVGSVHADTQDSACKAITCDCAALMKDEWKNLCKQQELVVKRKCENKHGGQGLYCSVHGPKANRLPLDLHLNSVDTLPAEALSPLYKNVAALYWTTYKDSQTLTDKLSEFSAAQVAQRTKILITNSESLFTIQRQITESWLALDEQDEARGAWNDFANDSRDMAEELDKLGRALWKHSGNLQGAEREGIENEALNILRTSGKVFEQAAHAYGESGQNDNAARTWKRAASSAEFLIEVSSASGPGKAAVPHLKYLRAARLFRAGYYWELDKRGGEAKDSLEKAKEVFTGNTSATPG